jgi:predicted acylesterase/phospholipase RssA
VRHDALSLDCLVLPHDEREDVAERIRTHVYSKEPSADLGKWVRYGIVPGVRRPGLTLFLGSPARYSAGGLHDWVATHIGDEAARSWPSRPTAIVAYDIKAGARAAFGTRGAAEVSIGDAVAASSAVPLVFRPYPIGDTLFVDGGVSSGTHADLVLGHGKPLDLVLVLAPMAAETHRQRARFHEKLFDKVGARSLKQEVELIRSSWPDTEIVTLTPSPSVQNAMRPNPLDPSRAVATFTRTLIAMKRTLAQPHVWSSLRDHLGPDQVRPSAAAR